MTAEAEVGELVDAETSANISLILKLLGQALKG